MRKNHRTDLLSVGGYTLMEMLISIVLIGVLSSVIAFTITNAFRAIDHAQRRKNLALEGTYSSETFRRDMSLAKDSLSFFAATNKLVRFKTANNQTVEYQLANSYLYRSITGLGNASVLAGNVNINNSQFSYYDRNDNVLSPLPLSSTNRQEIWTVKLTLQLDYLSESMIFDTPVFVKNFHINHVAAK